MSSLRNFVVMVLLAGVLGVVYFAINKSPKTVERSELAPPAALPPGQGLAGFPGTSISSTPPAVSLPPAPSSPVSLSPAAPAPGVSVAASPPASPFPSIAAPPKTTPPTPDSTPPTAGPGSLSPTVPTATITGVGTVASPAVPAVPAAAPGSALAVGAQPAPSAANPASSTVIVGQPATTPQTVFPAGTPGGPLAPGQVGIAAPASYFQTTPGPAVGAAPPTTPPSNASPQPAAPAQMGTEFLAVLQSAKTKLEAGRFAEAHLELSKYYTTARLNPEEWRLAADLLDQLAGTVLYSREHLLEPAYRVQPGDTLERVAMAYNVPCELLAKINGIRDTRQLVPGQEIKVLRGPFEAVVDLVRYEMTLLVGGRYAGRFAIGIGRDRANLEGAFVVRDKKANPIYFGPDRVIAADDPTNPLGERLLDLGNQMGLHGTDNPKNIGINDGRGTIRLSQRDVEDVYDILSIGSRVTIKR